MNEVLLAFLMGGLIIGSTNIASSLVGPEYASLIGGVPSGLIAPFFLNSRKQKKNFYWGYFLNSLAMIVVLLELHFLINKSKFSGYKIAAMSGITFMLLAPVLIYFFGHSEKKKRRR